MSKANQAITRLWKGRPASSAGFLDAAVTLRDSLIESHLNELDSAHHGDATHKGPAPEACSYCRAIEEFDQHHQNARAPEKQTIDCRGRNGYFKLANIEVHNYTQDSGDAVWIHISSKAGYRDAAPIMFQGSHADIENLLLYLLKQVATAKAQLSEQDATTRTTLKKIIDRINDGDIDDAATLLDALRRIYHWTNRVGKDIWKANSEVTIGTPEKALHYLEDAVAELKGAK